MKKLISVLAIVLLLLSVASITTVYAADVKNPLAVDDSALINAGAEKFWSGFKYDYRYGIFIFSLNSDNTITIYDCDSSAAGTVTVPAQIAGYKVRLGSDSESLGYRIFADCTNLKKVIVSKGVEYVGMMTFSECPSLEEVVLPDGLKRIWPYAFENSPNLKKVNIPESVTEVSFQLFDGTPIEKDPKNNRNGAFYVDSCLIRVNECSETFVVEEGTKQIASAAFYDTYVERIVFPDSLESISSGIGKNLYNLSINIPKNVKYIGQSFFFFSMITSIDVDPANKYFCSVNGALLSKDKKRFIKCTDTEDDFEVFYIPDGVEVIEIYAFERCSFSEIVIPATTTEIKDCAFESAYIEHITIPRTVKTFGYNLFRNALLYSIDLQCKLKVFPNAMFYMCAGLEKIVVPEGVEIIEDTAFTKCRDLKELVLPSTLKKIVTCREGYKGTLAQDCEKLETIRINGKNEYFTVVDGMLYNKDMTILYRCPTLYNETTVTLPSTVGKIVAGAFWGCKNIKTITIPEGPKYIASNTFRDCENLETVNLPASVNYLESFSFGGCAKLNILIPATVKRIENFALGYDSQYRKLNIKIRGYKGTIAATYAKELDFKFVSVGRVGKDYDKSISVDVSEQLKFFPVKNVMLDNVIYLFGDIYYMDIFDMTYFSMYAISDGFGFPISDDWQKIGTGTSASLTLLDEWDFTTYYFVRFGDADGNGVVNNADIRLAEKYIGKIVGEKDFSVMAVDLDGDKKITQTDVNNLKNIVNKKTTEEKVCHVFSSCANISEDSSVAKCAACEKTKSITHIYKTTVNKATFTANGSTVTVCAVCNKVKSESVVYSPMTVFLSSTSYTYDGKVKTPTVTVKDTAGKVLKNGTDYTVTYSEGRKNVGTYKVTVKMIGNYSGTKTLSFEIKSKTTSGKLGDVNSDNVITSADARMALRASVGLETLTAAAKKYADVNKDGKITSADARLILRCAVGLEKL